jgi:selenocysteine-specific elongation factor
VVGTAGHIDHGKTALVKALTGQETDRLPQEKERGISIDLGFAHMDIDGVPVAVVDVPGHERFIKNMLAGVSGIDLALLVVAADEGPMPQTREHLDILDLLGVRRGIAAVTKRDLVDDEWACIVVEEIHNLLAGTTLEASPVIQVSAVTGEGLEELRKAIGKVVSEAPARTPEGVARLPVDRVFTMPGFGTVVTGTLVSGEIVDGQRLDVMPQDFTVKVRQLEVHGKRVPRALAGQRVALNLAKVERGEVRRGSVLSEPGTLAPTWGFAGTFRLLSRALKPLASSTRVRLHVGTSEVLGRLVSLEGDSLDPGDEGLVRFKAEEPLAVSRGDRFIARSYSPALTIGGGRVITSRGRFRRLNHVDHELLRLLDQAEGPGAALVELRIQNSPVSLQTLGFLIAENPDRVTATVEHLAAGGKALFWREYGLVVHPEVYQAMAGKIRCFLGEYHTRHPMRRGAPREEVRGQATRGWDQRQFTALAAAMEQDGLLVVNKEVLALPGQSASIDVEGRQIKEDLEEQFRAGGFNPPPLTEVVAQAAASGRAGDVVRLLLEETRLIRVEDDMVFHADVVEEAKNRVRRFIQEQGPMTVADFRDLLGTSRRYALPLLGYLDRVRFTRREGDSRTLYGS